MAGLEELAVHRRRHLGASLHAQVIAEEDDVDVRTDSAKEPHQVRQMVLGTLIVVRVVVRAKSPSVSEPPSGVGSRLRVSTLGWRFFTEDGLPGASVVRPQQCKREIRG